MMADKKPGCDGGAGSNTSRNEAEQPTLNPATVDQMFLTKAQAALSAAGYAPIEFLLNSPGASKTDLAKTLGKGASAIGLVMAIFEEACREGVVRDVAKNLLVREIISRFPHGWSSSFLDGIGPLAKLSGWRSEVKRYGQDPRFAAYALSIIRELALNHPPADGWRPEPKNDPIIDELFDRFWPAGNE